MTHGLAHPDAAGVVLISAPTETTLSYPFRQTFRIARGAIHSGHPNGSPLMSEYVANVFWTRNGAVFTDNQYSRAHRWSFDGGAVVRASSSPLSVRIPMSDPAAVDPEEALVAAASSCHMLYFLALAARAGLVVDSYTDDAVGIMEDIGGGKKGIVRIALNPRVRFSGAAPPSEEAVGHLHHEAHQLCYIANSLKTQIEVRDGWDYTP